MKKIALFVAVAVVATLLMVSFKQKTGTVQSQETKEATVYLTREITPESLVRIYKALGVPAKGRVAIKMSTGEGSNPNYLKPELIKNLVFEVDGTIVECNTAYTSGPLNKKDDDEIRIPVKDQKHIKYDIVGGHMANYDFMIALSHFKGHPMGGYGGALKNLSIGCASKNGKAYIHSAGRMDKLDMLKLWTKYVNDQEGFLESMAAAAQAVANYFNKKEGIIYINVMNNMSIDCDCVDHPAPVKLEDYGILASTDPVALDQACIDIINNQQVTATNDPTDLLKRIDKQHGVHTIDHAEAIGLGTRKYKIVSIDK